MLLSGWKFYLQKYQCLLYFCHLIDIDLKKNGFNILHFLQAKQVQLVTLWHDIIWSLLLVYCVLYRFVIVFPSTLIKPTFLGLGHFDIDGEGFLHTSKNPSCAGQILPNLNQIENFIHQSLLILPNWNQNQIENFI